MGSWQSSGPAQTGHRPFLVVPSAFVNLITAINSRSGSSTIFSFSDWVTKCETNRSCSFPFSRRPERVAHWFHNNWLVSFGLTKFDLKSLVRQSYSSGRCWSTPYEYSQDLHLLHAVKSQIFSSWELSGWFRLTIRISRIGRPDYVKKLLVFSSYPEATYRRP